MEGFDILRSKHLRDLTREEQFEIATRALADVAEKNGAIASQLQRIADEFERLLKSMAKITCRLCNKGIEDALLESISTGEKDELGDSNASERVAE